ncbi:methionine aminopeptidase, type I [Abditibacterium utsteinense]|uniref:Methionine aminopeptidase n=1 Tax=Abditibacterium utsteinense TaxID=1960156 RepID=A0A2S8SUW5_9BACT|nr:type I methionyl aminopeptidase [Abditibacterium utsteinense]PQV64576.1 methionine aminopeptidase, type I [Abditibacterium utsteinense]
MAIIIKSKNDLKLMRKSGRAAQKLLNTLGEAAQAGSTGRELDAMARKLLAEMGARSPFLGKKAGGPPYPCAITVSTNEAIVHGIPTYNPFHNGDIVALDVGVLLGGFIGDTAGTFAIGTPAPRAERLMRITKEALYLGIEKAVVGNTVGDISATIQNHVESHGYSIVRELVGHGVGRTMHEDPNVPNFGKAGTGPKLRPGMTIAIEPMVNEGSAKVKCLSDQWTYVTADGQLSAHYEHTVAVLSDGPEILTIDERSEI